ncbi:DUF1775 domain-containing protein [Agrobacterium radiobacter]|uniref:DUF1775 domain-containing protein n=1 Tax=Agrobacterium TaxID=357 RepID=UPI001CBEEC91|nr:MULTISPECIES: DUF1775 domain-containing protein [Agrobacterium]MDA5241315.1 DUF1775 domain-containing protein [Agrobacterium sp. MAFF310724]MDA5249399.1 DUF1775 domain-containing protein [Agrobacterium sp. MAFF210268]MDO3445624.1 DUF1775 domain-containing protein [Agrobacterium sp. V1]UNZ54178.1 DUF1775 domain-containing protein [Agrobacterium tumefaciens]
MILAGAIGSTAAFAHATLANQQAPVSLSYRAVFRVGHNCDGKPTIKVRVQLPESASP